MKPTLFVASSVEGIELAKSLQLNLQHSIDVSLWNQTNFSPSTSTLESLLDTVRGLDFGVFVFSPDDVLRSRGKSYLSARDNVLFECGPFFGRLGRH